MFWVSGTGSATNVTSCPRWNRFKYIKPSPQTRLQLVAQSITTCSSLMYRSPNLTVRFACFWKIGVKSRVGAPQKMEDSRGEILISLTLVFWSTGWPKAKWDFQKLHIIHRKSFCNEGSNLNILVCFGLPCCMGNNLYAMKIPWKQLEKNHSLL